MLPTEITDHIKEAVEIIGCSTVNYLKVKRFVLNRLNPKFRKLFSTRHHSTKKHTLNDADLELIELWMLETGIKLEIEQEKLHNPEWFPKKRGWGLVLFNKQRKQKVREARMAEEKEIKNENKEKS